MGVRIYDSKLRKVVPLQTRDEGKVAMYCCGPTVYNYIHIGNARTLVWFEAIRRFLAYRGYDVTYVMNYTDVDDKIIDRANAEGIPPDGITSKYTKAFEDDMAALGARPADIVCRATDHIHLMVEAIDGLIDNGLAYEANGDVWFAVEKFSDYGSLSGRSLDDMRAGERVEPNEHKRHPLDFALWKSAKEGEPSWPSPWGPGRPGWHIECSVMSTKYLGMGFDVHGGASDLIFPHHENELAQAEGLARGRLDGTADQAAAPFVRHWMHAGLVQIDSEKMSKSLGNFVLAHDLLSRYDGEVLRYWILAGSYRSQAAFTEESLEDARSSYARWKTFAESVAGPAGDAAPDAAGEGDPYVRRFCDAMDDDFNSAAAFAVVHDLVKEGNKAAAAGGDALGPLVGAFRELTGVLGFAFPSSQDASGVVGGLLDFLLEMREEARAEKAYARSDAIRDRLTSLGVTIEDTPAGPRWRLGGPA